MASTEVDRTTGVDVADVPSANWGWSKINYRTWHIVGLVIVGFLLANVLWRTNVGHIEDWYLVAFAVLGLFVIVRDMWGRRRGWLR